VGWRLCIVPGLASVAALLAACLSSPPAAPPTANDAGTIDGPVRILDAGAADAFAPTPLCDTNTMTCVYTCDATSCDDGVSLTCPMGYHCILQCNEVTACKGESDKPIKVSCSGDCEIQCIADDACKYALVECTGARCSITCQGDDACRYEGVHCDAAACAGILCDGPCACEGGDGVCCNDQPCDSAICTATQGSGTCDCAL
jgi:hypothetical protein